MTTPTPDDTVQDRADAVQDRADAQRRVLHRLRRARGQLDAVIRAVESDGSCRDVVTQLAAVTHALNRAGFTIVSTAMQTCMSAEPDSAGGPTPAELEKIFLTLA